jgi:hypothetical protein
VWDHSDVVQLRSRLLISAALVAVSAAGCGIGEGSGSATGELWMLGCDEGDPLGTEAMPLPFNLNPTFFAGEPIEDIADTPPMNRLIIRMERSGNAVEINDTLYFDIRDSAQIARCLRGATDNGQPLWDTSSGTLDPTGQVDPNAPPWCEPSADPAVLPSIHLVPFGPVAVSFAPLASCHSSMHPPAFVNITGVADDGVITFEDFGGARQSAPYPDQATTPPDMRYPIDANFKVNYGDRLRATFQIVMGDERVAAAIRDKIVPPPAADIGGNLSGFFDFDFQRGRSAQTFP